jgi:RNA polymerase sigma-70 factor (ECF subfamily)
VGDPDRFRVLFEANYHLILGYAVRRVGAADAQDVTAETFAFAWRRLDSVPRGDDARLWLYGAARKVIANHRRSELRRLRLAGRLHEQPQPMAAAEAGGRVAHAFASLRPADRDLLGLVAWEGLDTAELSAVLGCSRSAVRLRLHRARRRLADELRRDEPHGARRIQEDLR